MRPETNFASPSSSDLANMANISSSATTLPPGSPRRLKVIPLQHPESAPGVVELIEKTSNNVIGKWKTDLKGMNAADWISVFLPCYRWIRSYRLKEYLQNDVVAGLTVAVMLVPQSMSYAKLAGLESIYGLYASVMPVFIYAIFGSSRQLAVGPVAMISLLVANVLSEIADSSDDLYTELAMLLALMVGSLQCLMGLLRLGWIIRFISHSVISGFTTASAIIIGLSQAKYYLGYDIESTTEIIPLVQSIISGSNEFTWQPFVMGICILTILLVMKHLGKTRKNLRFLQAAGPLTAIILGTAIVKIFNPSSITVVGEIPQGLPAFSVPQGFAYFKTLIPTAFLITGVAILESVGIAKALAAKNGYELDANRELLGLGVANVVGSFFSAYPATGSFSRSAVNNDSGAKTGFAGITTGMIMGCVLLFMTALFEDIPQCALAAIVTSAVLGLMDYHEAISLWRVDKKDFVLWVITFAITLFLGIEYGVLAGVGVSLAFVIHESANPSIAVLGRLPGTTIYRNIKQYPEAYTYYGIVLVRVDAPIYFANISHIKERLRKYEVSADKARRRGPEIERIYFVILEMSPVTYIDSSAIQTLKDLHQEYQSRDIQVVISNPNNQVLQTLARGGVVDLIGKEWFFVRAHDAVQVCLQQMQSLTNEVPRTPEFRTDQNKLSLLQRMMIQRREDLSSDDLESGDYHDIEAHLDEPLLPKRT